MIQSHFLDSAYRELTENEFQCFEKLYTKFVQINSQINLSAIRDEQGIWEKHFYDSLLGAEFLENTGDKILDLGSGGGFPALPLAIMFPEKQFFPFDSVGKKMKAVQGISDSVRTTLELSLQNVHPLVGRAEEFGQNPKYRAQFDVVTARAFAAFSVCLELALPFAKRGGKVILYRGPDNDVHDEKLAELFGADVITRKQARLPSGDHREIWEIVKVQETEERFPRVNGVPKKEPMTFSHF